MPYFVVSFLWFFSVDKWSGGGKLLIFFSFLVLCFQTYAFKAKVTKSIDGDSFYVTSEDTVFDCTSEIRLFLVDCPEKNNLYGSYPYSDSAKVFVDSIFESNDSIISTDTIYELSYKRSAAKVFVNSIDLGKALLKRCFACVDITFCKKDPSYCSSCILLESKAKKSRLGIWSDPYFVPPFKCRCICKNLPCSCKKRRFTKKIHKLPLIDGDKKYVKGDTAVFLYKKNPKGKGSYLIDGDSVPRERFVTGLYFSEKVL